MKYLIMRCHATNVTTIVEGYDLPDILWTYTLLIAAEPRGTTVGLAVVRADGLWFSRDEQRTISASNICGVRGVERLSAGEIGRRSVPS